MEISIKKEEQIFIENSFLTNTLNGFVQELQ